jgi:hypothetical protein
VRIFQKFAGDRQRRHGNFTQRREQFFLRAHAGQNIIFEVARTGRRRTCEAAGFVHFWYLAHIWQKKGSNFLTVSATL